MEPRGLPPAMVELIKRRVEPEIVQRELLKLSQEIVPTTRGPKSKVVLLSVLERLNAALQKFQESEVS